MRIQQIKLLIIGSAIALLSMGLLSSCNQGAESEQPEAAPAAKEAAEDLNQGLSTAKFDERKNPDALELAESNENFSTLVSLIKQAEVENAVKNQGPLTVFAPTNDALGKLPEDVVKKLTDPANKSKLVQVLVNHVAPANYPMDKLEELAEKGATLFMASGEYVPVEKKDDGIYVGGAKVVASYKVSNGWVHVVDAPIVPKNLQL